MDNPTFRHRGMDPVLDYSEEARRVMNSRSSQPGRCLPPQDVRRNAIQELKKQGGDEKNQLAVLGSFHVQFGQFRG